jgi:hypothetical protein
MLYTKQSKATIVRQWNKDTADFWQGCSVLLNNNYMFVNFCHWSWGFCNWNLTFVNRKTHFMLHNSYCSPLPMKRHAVKFLYSTVNMLCGSLNRLLTVWQCTEILLYSDRWGDCKLIVKVTVLRYLLPHLLIIIVITIIINISSSRFSADPRHAL